jgi:hypothetical protein
MILDKMDKSNLREYVDFLLWHYRLVDAFWYIYLEKEFGTEAADKLNEKVWGRAGALGARDIVKRFHIRGKGLRPFVEALGYFPWAILVGYDIVESADKVILDVPNCPVQSARISRGLGEYNCREMHRSEFEGFAHEIDPGISVQCVHAPPDPHPAERFCRWVFTMTD